MGLQRTITANGETLVFTFPDGQTGVIRAVRGTGGTIRLDIVFPREVKIQHVDAAGFAAESGTVTPVK